MGTAPGGLANGAEHCCSTRQGKPLWKGTAPLFWQCCFWAGPCEIHHSFRGGHLVSILDARHLKSPVSCRALGSTFKSGWGDNTKGRDAGLCQNLRVWPWYVRFSPTTKHEPKHQTREKILQIMAQLSGLQPQTQGSGMCVCGVGDPILVQSGLEEEGPTQNQSGLEGREDTG